MTSKKVIRRRAKTNKQNPNKQKIQTTKQTPSQKNNQPPTHNKKVSQKISLLSLFLNLKQLHRALDPNILQHIHDPQHWLFIMQFYFFPLYKNKYKI